MDTPTIIAVATIGMTFGSGLVAVTAYAVKVHSVATSASHKARNVDQALTLHRDYAEKVYVRKDAIAPELKSITQSLERIEERQTGLIDRLLGPGA
jgi:hypothetical protein